MRERLAREAEEAKVTTEPEKKEEEEKLGPSGSRWSKKSTALAEKEKRGQRGEWYIFFCLCVLLIYFLSALRTMPVLGTGGEVCAQDQSLSKSLRALCHS